MISVHERLRIREQVNDAIAAKGNRKEQAGRCCEAGRLAGGCVCVLCVAVHGMEMGRRRIHRMYMSLCERV